MFCVCLEQKTEFLKRREKKGPTTKRTNGNLTIFNHFQVGCVGSSLFFLLLLIMMMRPSTSSFVLSFCEQYNEGISNQQHAMSSIC